MKKILLVVLVIIMIATMVAACGQSETSISESTPASVATLAGPTGMGMIQMFKNKAYDVSLFTNPDQISPKIINGETDIAAIPSNLAAVIYNKTKGNIQVVAVNTMGVLYILENGNTINSIEDLAGKTIYATGQGATPEYVLNKILEANGLENVTVQFMGAHADLANAMAAGEVTLALLPEPYVSTVLASNSDVQVKIDINAEWKKIFGEDAGIPMGVMVVSKEFAKDKAAMDKLIADCSASVDYVVSDPSGASKDIAGTGIVASEAVAASAIPRCGISFITGDNCKSILTDYFDVMISSNPKSLGGPIPDDSFYYMP
ncbi:MAG: ABC transporter substrate-binding protein [Christensenellales bacterium]|jgi:NitT/TauT family transport system substrate-binding protein